MSLPNPQPVLDLIEAFRRSKTMFAAVALGVFDALHEGPASAAELAARLSANADAMGRLLDGCAALGLLRKNGAVDRNGAVYQNDAVAETYLCAGSAHSLRGYVRYSDAALYGMWGHLEDAVREGTHRWPQSFGLAGPIFSAFFRSDEAMRDFLMGMHGFGMLTSPHVVRAFDLSRFHRLVDLGGATGHLAIAACERYAELRAVVFDLARATPLAREQVAKSRAFERIEVVAGDFFEDELPEADSARLDGGQDRALTGPDFRAAAGGRGFADWREAAGRRWRGAARGKHAIAQYVDCHRGQGTLPERVYRTVAARGLRCGGSPAHGRGSRCDSGGEGVLTGITSPIAG
jgi:hypothetical protein